MSIFLKMTRYSIAPRIHPSIQAKRIFKAIIFRASFALGLSGLIFPVSGWCQMPPQPLRSLVQGAVERDSRLLEAQARLTAAGTKIDSASAAYQPSLDFSVRANQNKRWGSATQLSTDEDRAVVNSLQMKWNLFRSGGDAAYVAATTSAYVAAQHALRQSRLDVLSELLQAMFDYRKAAALIVSAAQYRDQTHAFAKRLERSAQLGRTSALEVERALVRNEDSIQIFHEFAAQRDAAAAVLQKKFAIDIDPLLPPLTMLTALSSSLQPFDSALCNPDKLADTPLIAQRDAELATRRHQISAARAAYGPKLDLQVTRNAGRHFYGDLSGELSEKRVDLMLSIPLFDGGHIRAQVQEATALKAQAQAALDTVRTDNVVNRMKNCAKWRSVQLSATNAENSWRRMGKIMAGLEREHQLGFRNSFDALDASRDSFAVARQFVEHVYDNRLLVIQLRLNDVRGADDDQYADLVADALELL